MNRRQVVSRLLALGAMAAPMHANAQVAKDGSPFRIVTLPDLVFPSGRTWFIEAMREFGQVEGRDFIVVPSGIESIQREFDETARRVVADQPDLIFGLSSASAAAVHRATKTIPIVMLFSGYPVEAGLAVSLRKPGKNVTGNTMYAGLGIWGKLLQLLRETRPGIRRVSVLWSYAPPTYLKEETESAYAELRDAERLLGLKLHIVEVARADQVPSALAEIDTEQPDALLLTSGLAIEMRATVMQFAEKKRLPTISDNHWTSVPGVHPLLSYGPVAQELVRNAAFSIAKIMRGAFPGDLPIQQPSRFLMVVNLKEAAVIELTVPPELLLRADRVIE